MTTLPHGFVLDDDKQTGLPEGFVMDDAPAPAGDAGRGFLSFLNQGIASAVGAPVDIMGAVVNRAFGDVARAAGHDYQPVEPFGGSASIGHGLSALGARVAEPAARPETLAEYMGQGLGGAAGSLLPGAGIVGTASRSASPVVSGSAQTISRPFISTPGRALATEAAAGAGAGVGMSVADQVAPDDPYAQMAGAMIGGGIAGIGPNLVARGVRSLPGVQLAEDFVAGQIAPFTERGAMNRARGRIGGLVEDAATARANLERGTISDLSPAVSTGDRRLMALEQAVRSQEPSADLAMRRAETAAAEILRGEMIAPAQGASVDATRRFASDRISGLVGRMDERVAEAQMRARQRVAALDPQQGQAQASAIVREELETALTAARTQEREIWSAVPRDAMVPTDGARQTYRTLIDDLPRAQRSDVPALAREFLDEGGNQSFRAQETVREVHGLYSGLRDTARNARAGDTPNRNQARLADELADAILDDMNSVSGASAPLREALDFSRNLNRTFRQGSVGRVLGSEATGADRVPDILTLDRTIGRPGRQGAVAFDEVERALQPRVQPSQQAMQDYITSRFQDAAVRNGDLNPSQAESFLRSSRDVLDRMPDAREQIMEALLSSEAAQRMRDTMASRSAGVQRQSAASILTGARPGEEIRSILRSRNPRETAAQLMRQARRDPTGQAALGLKGALLDDLMSSARRADFDDAGNAMISGRAIRSRLHDGPLSSIAEEILSPAEQARMRQIAEEFGRLETMQGRLPDIGPIMGDQPNSIVAYLARVIAARSGAAMGAGTSGASLQTAAMASNRMQRILQSLTNDRAEQLIIRAVTGDRELFDALLQPASQITRQQENRIIETLAGITAALPLGYDPEVIEALSDTSTTTPKNLGVVEALFPTR